MKQLNKSSNYNRAANLGKLACKGAIPWNRGIHRTEEVKEKLRIFRKNFYKNNPHPKGMLGKHHTKETIEKIRINSSTPEINKKKAAGTRKYVLSQFHPFTCLICEKYFLITKKRKRTQKYCSNKCRYKARRNIYQRIT